MEQCDREEGKKERRRRRRRRKSVRFFPAAKLQLNIEKSDGADRQLQQNTAGLSDTDQSQPDSSFFTTETNNISSRSTYSLILQLLTISPGLHQQMKLLSCRGAVALQTFHYSEQVQDLSSMFA